MVDLFMVGDSCWAPDSSLNSLTSLSAALGQGPWVPFMTWCKSGHMVLVSSSLISPSGQEMRTLNHFLGSLHLAYLSFCFLGEEAQSVGTREDWRLPSNFIGSRWGESHEKRDLLAETLGDPWVK